MPATMHTKHRYGDRGCASHEYPCVSARANDEGPEQFMIVGYAGWQGGQLESEIARNVWLTVEADPSVLFDQPFERRLDAAAGLLGVDQLGRPDAGHKARRTASCSA